jgi:outer membrane protein TolC
MNNIPGKWVGRVMWNAALSLVAACLLCACDYSRYEQGYPIADRALRQTEPLDLAETSTTQPTTKPVIATTPSTRRADELLPPPPAEISLSIDECRQLALANNLDLKVELYNPTIASESISEERARFESVFTASVNYNITDQATASKLENSQSKGLSTNVGVTVPLRTGGQVQFGLPINRFETNNSFSTLNPSYTSDFDASITQPLLRGAGLAVNSHGIRIATYQYQTTQAQTKLQVITVLADVDRIYWRLYAARKELEVRKKEYDLAVAQLERARRQAKAGMLAEVDVVRAESGVADKLEGIITSETNLRDRQRELKQVINRPDLGLASPTIIIPTSVPNVLHYPLDKPLLIQRAHDGRMELLETEIQIAVANDNVAFARNGLLPVVNFEYQYNISGLGRTLSDSFSTLRSTRFQGHAVGLTVEVPIGNEAARSQLRRALATRLQSIATKDQRSLLIEREILHACDQLEANWQRIIAAQRRVILAARVVDVETRQFEQQLRTSTDVLDAQTRLADAQSSEIAALTDYQIAQIDIAFATGTLLGRAGVAWQPTSIGQSKPDAP